jgi:HPt (histidine-containing phosphotransfer) domain-containing protein
MIEWERVEELKEDFGDEGFQEIIEIFLSEVEEAINQLPNVTDDSAASDQLHFIKGSALNLGFSDLANLCEPRLQGGRIAKAPEVAACYQTSKATFMSDPRVA